MALLFTGHGRRWHTPGSFIVPKGFTVYFWTRESRKLQSSVASRIEFDPDTADLRLAVNRYSGGSLCPNYVLAWIPGDCYAEPYSPEHIQITVMRGETLTLEEGLYMAALYKVGNPESPMPVHWLACRSDSPDRRSWEGTLRNNAFMRGSASAIYKRAVDRAAA
jgi:hypothetical protein